MVTLGICVVVRGSAVTTATAATKMFVCKKTFTVIFMKSSHSSSSFHTSLNKAFAAALVPALVPATSSGILVDDVVIVINNTFVAVEVHHIA